MEKQSNSINIALIKDGLSIITVEALKAGNNNVILYEILVTISLGGWKIMLSIGKR